MKTRFLAVAMLLCLTWQHTSASWWPFFQSEEWEMSLLTFVSRISNLSREERAQFETKIQSINQLRELMQNLDKGRSAFAQNHPKFTKHAGTLQQLIHHRFSATDSLLALVSNAVDAQKAFTRIYSRTYQVKPKVEVSRPTLDFFEVKDYAVGMSLADVIFFLLSPYHSKTARYQLGVGVREGISFFSALHFLKEPGDSITVRTSKRGENFGVIVSFFLDQNKIQVRLKTQLLATAGTTVQIRSSLLLDIPEADFESALQKRFKQSSIAITYEGGAFTNGEWLNQRAGQHLVCIEKQRSGWSSIAVMQGEETIDYYKQESVNVCKQLALILPPNLQLSAGGGAWSVQLPKVKEFIKKASLDAVQRRDFASLNSLLPVLQEAGEDVLMPLRLAFDQDRSYRLPTQKGALAVRKVGDIAPIIISETIAPTYLPPPDYSEPSANFYWSDVNGTPFASIKDSNERYHFFIDRAAIGGRGSDFFFVSLAIFRLWASKDVANHKNLIRDPKKFYDKKEPHTGQEEASKNENETVVQNENETTADFFQKLNEPSTPEGSRLAAAALAVFKEGSWNHYSIGRIVNMNRRNILALCNKPDSKVDMKTVIRTLAILDKLIVYINKKFIIYRCETILYERLWLVIASNLDQMQTRPSEHKSPFEKKILSFIDTIANKIFPGVDIDSPQKLKSEMTQYGLLTFEYISIWLPLLDGPQFGFIETSDNISIGKKGQDLSKHPVVKELLFQDDQLNQRIIEQCLNQNPAPFSWIGEIIKNSNEAGAKNLDISLRKNQSGNYVMITDSGSAVAKGDMPLVYVPNLSGKEISKIDPNFGRGFYTLIAAFSSVLFLSYPGTSFCHELSFEKMGNTILLGESERRSTYESTGVSIYANLGKDIPSNGYAMSLLIKLLEVGQNIPGTELTFNGKELPRFPQTSLDDKTKVDSYRCLVGGHPIELNLFTGGYEGIFYNSRFFRGDIRKFFGEDGMQSYYSELGVKFAIDIKGRLPQTADRRNFINEAELTRHIQSFIYLGILRALVKEIHQKFNVASLVSYDFYYDFGNYSEIRHGNDLVTNVINALNRGMSTNLMLLLHDDWDYYSVKRAVHLLKPDAKHESLAMSRKAIVQWLDAKEITFENQYIGTDTQFIARLNGDASLIEKMGQPMLDFFCREINWHLRGMERQKNIARENQIARAKIEQAPLAKKLAPSRRMESPKEEPLPAVQELVDFDPNKGIPELVASERPYLISFVSFLAKVYAQTLDCQIQPRLYYQADQTNAHTVLGKVRFIAFNILGHGYREYVEMKKKKVYNHDNVSDLLNTITHEFVHYEESSSHSTHDRKFDEKQRKLFEKVLLTPNLQQILKEEFSN